MLLMAREREREKKKEKKERYFYLSWTEEKVAFSNASKIHATSKICFAFSKKRVASSNRLKNRRKRRVYPSR